MITSKNNHNILCSNKKKFNGTYAKTCMLFKYKLQYNIINRTLKNVSFRGTNNKLTTTINFISTLFLKRYRRRLLVLKPIK